MSGSGLLWDDKREREIFNLRLGGFNFLMSAITNFPEIKVSTESQFSHEAFDFQNPKRNRSCQGNTQSGQGTTATYSYVYHSCSR